MARASGVGSPGAQQGQPSFVLGAAASGSCAQRTVGRAQRPTQSSASPLSRPRIRYLKPEIWQSRDFRALSAVGRETFICLISNADDEGRMKTDAAHLAHTFLDEPPADVEHQLELMEERRMITTYRVRGDRFIALLGWKHQRVNHPSPSDLPAPPKFKKKSADGSPRKRQLDLASLLNAQERDSTNPSTTTITTTTASHANGALAHADARRLVEQLLDSLAEWNAKRKSSPAKDIEEAERLIRIDQRPIDEALEVLSWATHDEFWRPNILSLSKFRKQYDTLRGQMQRRGPVNSLERSTEELLRSAAQHRMEGN